MKKIVLAAALLLVAFTGNSSLKGSILVNTVSFADLPDKPTNQINKAEIANTSLTKPVTSVCTVKVKTVVESTATCVPIKWCVAPVSQ